MIKIVVHILTLEPLPPTLHLFSQRESPIELNGVHFWLDIGHLFILGFQKKIKLLTETIDRA